MRPGGLFTEKMAIFRRGANSPRLDEETSNVAAFPLYKNVTVLNSKIPR